MGGVAIAFGATAPEETEGWKTVEGKATQRKKKNELADQKSTMETNCKPPTKQNGGWGKKSHQLMNTNTPPKKTWADVIKAGGINVQIVLGNGNLGLRTLMKMRGERRGGAAWRLTKRREDGETGAKRRGNEGPEVIPSRGNKGGQMEKHGRGREEERQEPGAAAPVQVGYLDQMMRG
jgi:hypothetical protein